jgi:hypothetical protein
VPDRFVGIILGKGGKALQQLQYTTGCWIQVSNRDDFVPGTSSRRFVISGQVEKVKIAEFIINQKLQAARAVVLDARGDDHEDAQTTTTNNNDLPPPQGAKPRTDNDVVRGSYGEPGQSTKDRQAAVAAAAAAAAAAATAHPAGTDSATQRPK